MLWSMLHDPHALCMLCRQLVGNNLMEGVLATAIRHSPMRHMVAVRTTSLQGSKISIDMEAAVDSLHNIVGGVRPHPGIYDERPITHTILYCLPLSLLPTVVHHLS